MSLEGGTVNDTDADTWKEWCALVMCASSGRGQQVIDNHG